MLSIPVLTHPRVSLAKQGEPRDGHYLLRNSKLPLWQVLTNLAVELSCSAILDVIPELAAEDVSATLHFTAALMAQSPDLPLSAAQRLDDHPRVMAPRFPRHAYLRGCKTSIPAILSGLGDSLDVGAVLNTHALQPEDLTAALNYAAAFLDAFRAGMLEEVTHLKHQAPSPPELVNVFWNRPKLPQ